MSMEDAICGVRCMASSPDKIYIRDLACRCIVGVNPEERTRKQDITINVTLEADLTRSCATDCIDDTVDYKEIKRRILTAVEESEYFLIERLASAVADICLSNSRVQGVTVAIDKPGALRFARSVGVEIMRNRT